MSPRPDAAPGETSPTCPGHSDVTSGTAPPSSESGKEDGLPIQEQLVIVEKQMEAFPLKPLRDGHGVESTN